MLQKVPDSEMAMCRLNGFAVNMKWLKSPK